MAYENLILEHQDYIAIVKINRPKALNALNSVTLQELSQVFTEIAQDKNVRVVLLTGNGEKSFVAGADIAEMSKLNPMQAQKFSQLGHRLMNQIENLPQPVIAVVNGFALGGGTELALACDIRIAGEKAKFGQPEVGLGLLAGFGGTQRLPRLVGSGRASEILFTADTLDAQEAYRIGLVNRVYPQEDLMNQAVSLANKIASRAPMGVQLSKSAIHVGQNIDIVSGQAYESAVFGEIFSSEDQKEGCRAFLEKSKYEYKGV